MTTPNAELPELAANQAQPHLTLNSALRRIDALLQASILSILSTPPGSPVDGDRHIVGGSPTGEFVGHTDDVAARIGSSWVFITPQVGWLVFLRSANALYIYGVDSPDTWTAVVTGGAGILADAAWTSAGEIVYGTGAGTAAILPPAVSVQALFGDGAGGLYWDTLTPPAAVRYMNGYFPGVPAGGQLIHAYMCDDHVYFYVGDMEGQARVGATDSPEAEVIVKISGTIVGRLSFDSSGYAFGTDEGPNSPQHAYPGEVIEFYNQAVADSTLADIAISAPDTPAP